MLTIILKIFSVFAIIGIGYAASKTGILPTESKPYLVNLLLCITTPCMIVSSMSSKTLDAHTATLMVQILIGSCLFFICASLISYIIVVYIFKADDKDAGALMVSMTAVNSGFMGFPVTKAIFGDTYFFLMVIENIVLNIYLFGFSVFQIDYGYEKKNSLKSLLASMKNMANLALLIGLFLMLTKIQLPATLSDIITTVGDATVPLSMIVVGIQLAENKISDIIKNRQLIICALCSLLLMPGLTLLAVHWLPIMAEAKLILVFAAAFPTAVATAAIAMQRGRNAALMAQGIALTVLLSLVTLPIFAMLLMKLYVA